MDQSAAAATGGATTSIIPTAWCLKQVDSFRNRRRIAADTALRLGLYFGNSPEFWLNLQMHYDLKVARRNLPPEEAMQIKARSAA